MTLGSGGVSPVAGGAQGTIPQWPGIYYGTVSNNADPNKKNRCLLRIPQILGSAVTTWAVSLTPLQQPPKVGTLIVAMFLGGDIDYPCYLVVNPQLAVESSAANIKPVGTTSSAGTSVKYAAADHVHGTINTTNATISTITQGATASAGTSPQIAAADHVHAMGTLNYLPAGTSGFLSISSSLASGGDTDAEIILESLQAGGRTTAIMDASLTEVTGNLQVDGSNISLGGTASITPANFNMYPPMATPPNYPLPTDGNTGSSWATGERDYINNIVACLNALISSLQNRGLVN